MSKVKKRVYDNETRTWKQVTVDVKNKNSSSKRDKGKKKNGSTGTGTSDSKAGKKATTSKTTKKVNKKTLRSLTGSLSFIPNENTIKIKPRDTIELHGLGKYLSGKYYVESIERTLSSSGYTQTANVIKTNFRKSVKLVAKYPDEKSKLKAYDSIYKKNLSKYKSTHKGAKPKKHVVKKGDTLYSISKKYFKTTKYAKKLARINGNLAKSKWKKLPVGYRLVIAKK